MRNTRRRGASLASAVFPILSRRSCVSVSPRLRTQSAAPTQSPTSTSRVRIFPLNHQRERLE
eukprot:9487311-Pyramimonas_sp.AAC.4